jgi:hypothetical protein
VLFVDLILNGHTSRTIQCIKCTYSVKQGLWQISILLVQGGIPEGLRDFRDPAVHVHMKRLELTRLVLGLQLEGCFTGEEARACRPRLMSEQFD